MNAQRYLVQAPGKLFIAGEYAVTEPDQDSIVVAVDRYLAVDIQSSNLNRLDLPQLNLTDIGWSYDGMNILFTKTDKRLDFIKSIFETILAFTGEEIKVHLAVTSELDHQTGRKYGLGSSAALSVALVTALLMCSSKHQHYADNKMAIFKLASIAHFKAQGNGSCADIAASTFGGWLNYRTFDSEWLVNQLKQEIELEDLVKADWPALKISPLQLPENLHFLVGWTGSSASTAPLVTKVRALKRDKPQCYQAFLQNSQKAVSCILAGFSKGEPTLILSGVEANRQALKRIAIEASVNIETSRLSALIKSAEPFGAGKTSGAGAGDCGIALINRKRDIQTVYHAWQEAGIEPLPLNVPTTGVKIF